MVLERHDGKPAGAYLTTSEDPRTFPHKVLDILGAMTTVQTLANPDLTAVVGQQRLRAAKYCVIDRLAGRQIS